MPRCRLGQSNRLKLICRVHRGFLLQPESVTKNKTKSKDKRTGAHKRFTTHMSIIRLVLVRREAKVGNDGLPSTVLAKDVLWLQVAVDDATCVHAFKSNDLGED